MESNSQRNHFMKTYTLEEIKELEAKATKGPWQKVDDGYINDDDCNAVASYCEYESGVPLGNYEANSQFIAASRIIVPQLVGQLEKAIEALKYYYGKFWQEYCVGDRPIDDEDEFHRQTLKELGVE